MSFFLSLKNYLAVAVKGGAKHQLSASLLPDWGWQRGGVVGSSGRSLNPVLWFRPPKTGILMLYSTEESLACHWRIYGVALTVAFSLGIMAAISN